MRLSKVLMDGGSGLNILYASPLDRMGIPQKNLCPSRAPFYGIILGKEAMPLGRIWLNVTFGQPDNFWKEPLAFEMVDFPGIHHALLGRPCFAKFMAVPNYTYLKLKMPGPNGVITVESSFEQAYYHEQDYVAQAATLSAIYVPVGSGCDVARVPMKAGIKVMAKLDQPSIGKVPDATGDSDRLASPSI
jgi:hypothetical protein